MAKRNKHLDTSFKNWIRAQKVEEVSKLLDVRTMTVYNWLWGRVLPRASHMKLIKKLSKGKVGYEQIIEGSLSPLK